MCHVPEVRDPEHWLETDILAKIVIYNLSIHKEQGKKLKRLVEVLAEEVGLKHDYNQLGINYLSFSDGDFYIKWMTTEAFEKYHREAEILWTTLLEEDEISHAFNRTPRVVHWNRTPYSKLDNLRSAHKSSRGGL